MQQGRGKKLEGALKSPPPVPCFRDSSQQIAPEFYLTQLRLQDSDVKIALSRMMPVNRNFIHAGAGCNVASADAVVTEIGKQVRGSSQNALFCAAFSETG